jgi:hypothetical protein
MKTIKKNELTRFFTIITDNELSSRKKVEAYVADKQIKAAKLDVFSDEGIAIRKEVELIFVCHNYLSEITRNSSVKSNLLEYLNR